MTNIALEKHNENTTRYVEATFLDKNGAQAAPVSARYRVDNVTESAAVVAWTSIPSPLAVNEIVVTATENAMLGLKKEEIIEVTFEGTYSANDKVSGKVQYALVNLTYVP